MKWHEVEVEVGDLATWLASIVAVLTFVLLLWSNARERKRADRAEAAAVQSQAQINKALMYIGDSLRHQQKSKEGAEGSAREPSLEQPTAEIQDQMTGIDSLEARLESRDLDGKNASAESREAAEEDLAALREILTGAHSSPSSEDLRRGLRPEARAEVVIDEFIWAGSADARAVADHLASSGWRASSPPRARYVFWTYSGSGSHTVSLYQNIADVAVSRPKQMDLVQGLAGAKRAGSGRDVRFSYAAGVDDALAAADRLRRFADASSQ